ncbi:MAG: N-methylhydantoinase, partial [Thermoleophilaceae bacterium]|nr:N-methylhydantoinase [Thermoleophilaceae bacterium]
FALVAGGGAGPLHAVEIARELGIPHIVVPLVAGVTSALGILQVDLRHDFLRPVLTVADQLDPADLSATFDDMAKDAEAMLDAENIAVDRRAVEISVDVRYYGQTPYINLALTEPPRSAGAIQALIDRYGEQYEREFGYRLPSDVAKVEIVNARMTAIGASDPAELQRHEGGGGDADAAKTGERDVYFREHGDFAPTPLYDRSLLRPGAELTGPAIVEQADTTVLLPPGTRARVDDYLNLVLDVSGS